MKKLTRSEKNKQIAGVCGGIAEYYSVDPTLVRVGAVLVTILTGLFPGIFAYVVLILVIPPKNGRSIIDIEIEKDKNGQ
jgi:phage shock protein C